MRCQATSFGRVEEESVRIQDYVMPQCDKFLNPG